MIELDKIVAENTLVARKFDLLNAKGLRRDVERFLQKTTNY